MCKHNKCMAIRLFREHGILNCWRFMPGSLKTLVQVCTVSSKIYICKMKCSSHSQLINHIFKSSSTKACTVWASILLAINMNERDVFFMPYLIPLMHKSIAWTCYTYSITLSTHNSFGTTFPCNDRWRPIQILLFSEKYCCVKTR